jgi:hypothetical protein
MITIAWNPFGFHVVDMLAKGETCNATHHIGHILQPILELHPDSVRIHLVGHADNARSHTIRTSQEFCEQNSPRIAPIGHILRIWHRQICFIRVCKALSKGKFISFRESTSRRDWQRFEGNRRNYFDGHVQGMNGETGLDRRRWISLLLIKQILACLFLFDLVQERRCYTLYRHWSG